MRFDVITLFPELFAPFLSIGVTRRAFASRQVQVELWNLRDYALGNYRRVDDRPFGGGPGMVMMAEPLMQCLEAVHAAREQAAAGDKKRQGTQDAQGDKAPLVLFSPAGTPLKHENVVRWAQNATGAILLCGRYEGIDQRFIDTYVDEQISLGDFVLSGGEIAAMALLDAVARLQPGVLNTEGSHVQDSFNPAQDGLLDYPHYTRPVSWQDQVVPDVLQSGNHAQIERWRRQQSLALTARLRPDLIAAARASGRLDGEDESVLEML